MKNRQETTRICQRILACHRRGETVALATVVMIKGSTYRGPGAKLLIEPDGGLVGNVSGGCLEADVGETGLEVIRTGQALVKHYDTSDEVDRIWGLGLGCNGEVDLLIQALPPGELTGLIEAWLRRLEGRETLVVRYRIAGPGPLGLLGLGGADPAPGIFMEVLKPPPRLIVCGAGDDARPIVRFAAEVGFRVTVVDHRSAFRTEARFPEAAQRSAVEPEAVDALACDGETFVLIKTHSAARDRAWLQAFQCRPVRYIGLLGPKARKEELVKDLDPGLTSRIFGPVGLDLGGEGPEQVGLSIVAEMMAVWFDRESGHLKDRDEPNHGE